MKQPINFWKKYEQNNKIRSWRTMFIFNCLPDKLPEITKITKNVATWNKLFIISKLSEFQCGTSCFCAQDTARLKSMYQPGRVLTGDCRKYFISRLILCWQNPIPCDCRTEVLISLLAVNWRWFSVLGGFHIPFYKPPYPHPISNRETAGWNHCG